MPHIEPPPRPQDAVESPRIAAGLRGRLRRAATKIRSALTRWVRGLMGDMFFLLLLGGLVVLGFVAPERIASYPSLVDWPTMAALTGLLALTKGLEQSGGLRRLGRWLIGFMATERAAALGLVLAAALLSMVLTNDVALFVVVPLTLGVCRITALPATRLIVFEALAVNAGSALTPIGNPQNLFLWQRSGVAFGSFVLHMLPLAGGLMLALLALTGLVFRGRPIRLAEEAAPAGLDSRLLGVSLMLYVPFLVGCDLHRAGWAVAGVLGAMLLLRPSLLARLDWALLLVFLLMFVDLRLLVGLEAARRAIHALDLDSARHLYFASIGASQIVSNVPAAIALAESSADWRVLAYGVNIGGFGLMIGSMANLITLRMTGDRRAWLGFHAVSLPFLGLATGLGYALLFIRHLT